MLSIELFGINHIRNIFLKHTRIWFINNIVSNDPFVVFEFLSKNLPVFEKFVHNSIFVLKESCKSRRKFGRRIQMDEINFTALFSVRVSIFIIS